MSAPRPMSESRHLYESWLDLMAELRKVSKGNGNEKHLAEAISDLIMTQNVAPDVVARVVESAGASALYGAQQCKECAGHARDAARKTLLDFSEPKQKTSNRKKAKAS